MLSMQRRPSESSQCGNSSLVLATAEASSANTSSITITTYSSDLLQNLPHPPPNRSVPYSDGPCNPPSSCSYSLSSSSSCFLMSGSARSSSNLVGFEHAHDRQCFRCIRLPTDGGFMRESKTSRLVMERRKRIGPRSLCKYHYSLSLNQDSNTDISLFDTDYNNNNNDDEYSNDVVNDTINGITSNEMTKPGLPTHYQLELLWRFCYYFFFCWFYHCRLWRSYLMLAILLFGGLSPVLVMGEYPRVVIMVEKYAEKSPWEFHSRSSRQAEISRKTWDEYVLYKEQTCRTNTVDSSSAAADYFDWEEMTFHKKLRLKLLPPSLSKEPQIAKNDAMMLSKIDSRLLAPEAESLCQMGMHDDSEQNEVAEKDKFEDTLISRSVVSFDNGLGFSMVKPVTRVVCGEQAELLYSRMHDVLHQEKRWVREIFRALRLST